MGRSFPFGAGLRRQPARFTKKTAAYGIFRHNLAGRKDVLHWTDADRKALAELEIYRPGGEMNQARPATAGIAARMETCRAVCGGRRQTPGLRAAVHAGPVGGLDDRQ